MTIAAGTKLGRYEIRSKIGEGGMGEVYLAQDTKLDRKVALKIFPAELTSNHDRPRPHPQEDRCRDVVRAAEKPKYMSNK
jgi:serine/threonine protein kinase